MRSFDPASPDLALHGFVLRKERVTKEIVRDRNRRQVNRTEEG